MTTSTLTHPTAIHPTHLGPVDDTTRRDFLGIIGAAGLGLVLGACGDEGAGESDAAGDTRMYSDALGNDAEIPANPQRIVGMHSLVGAQLLALDAPVVGIAGLDADYLTDFDLDGIADVGGWDAPDFEKILRLEPDLIIYNVFGGSSDAPPSDIQQKLREIAPVVIIEHSAAPGQRLPGDLVAPYADIVGADEGKLAAADEEYRAIVAEVAELLGPDPAAFQVAFLALWEGTGTLQVARQASPVTHTLLQAGASFAYNVDADLGEPNLEMSIEALNALKVDVLYLFDWEGGANLENPAIDALPVVKAGQAIRSSDSLGNLASYPAFIKGAAALRDELKRMTQPLRSDIV